MKKQDSKRVKGDLIKQCKTMIHGKLKTNNILQNFYENREFLDIQLFHKVSLDKSYHGVDKTQIGN